VAVRSRAREIFLGSVLCLLSSCSTGSDYCSSHWNLSGKFGSCDITQFSPGLQTQSIMPNPAACETALANQCSATEQATLNAEAICLNQVVDTQASCVDGGETAWSENLLTAQRSCRDGGVGDVCLTALEDSQQPDAGSPDGDGGNGDGGPVDFCLRSVSAAYDVGSCDFGSSGLNLYFVGKVATASELPTCESGVTNCTETEVATLNAQVDCADEIPSKVGVCQDGGEAVFVSAAEAQYGACLATSANLSRRCRDPLASFYPKTPDGG
jgi:hypothetical protein